MPIYLFLTLGMMASAGPGECPPPAGATPAAVCKCGYPSVEGAFGESRAVFSGVVLEVRDIPPVSSVDSAGRVVAVGGLWNRSVTLRVTRGWKGAQPGGSVAVQDVVVCGVGFRTGEEYLVYAYASEDGTLYTSPCQRTRVITPPGGAHDFRLPPPSDDVRVLDSIIRTRRP